MTMAGRLHPGRAGHRGEHLPPSASAPTPAEPGAGTRRAGN